MKFEENVMISFKKARNEIAGIRSGVWQMYEDQNALKKSVNDWIMFLVKENKELRNRIIQLEKLNLQTITR